MLEERVIRDIKLLNVIDLIGMTIILVLAFFMQFYFNQLPCPLCLLQRLGLLAIGFGFLLNIRYHIHPAHYSLSLLAAVFTAFVAMRQILLHIVPGSGAYGDAIGGLHLYTWVFIVAFATIIYIAVIMSFSAQYLLNAAVREERDKLRSPWIKRLSHIAFAVFFLVAIGNVVSTLAECGLQGCPDNPIKYVL